MSAKRRRLRRDIDIQETATGVSGYMVPEHWTWVRVNGEDYPIHRRLLDILTEPIPREPSGKPKVGDEVSGGWLGNEWECGRYHVVRNPDGSPGSWCGEVDGTECVLREDGGGADRHDGPYILLAKHPVERWPVEDLIPPVQPDGGPGVVPGGVPMSGHTPGPWTVADQEDADPVIVAVRPDGIRPVAWSEHIGLSPDTVEANAHLIAAAPELLAALKEIVVAWDIERQVYGSQIVVARAAIAKAEGGTE